MVPLTRQEGVFGSSNIAATQAQSDDVLKLGKVPCYEEWLTATR